jgi:hypothetical protein
MKKEFAVAMVAIILMPALIVPIVMSGDVNTANLSKADGDGSAKYLFDKEGMIISSTITIANKPNVSVLEHPVDIASTTDIKSTSNLVGKIVFDSDRDGDREIYVMNADGTNAAQLTSNMADDSNPSWWGLQVWDPWIYDTNGNGVIEKNEAGNAAKDYFDGEITMEQALEVLLLYFVSQA